MATPEELQEEQDFFSATDMLRGVASGGVKAGYALATTAYDFTNWAGLTNKKLPDYHERIDKLPEDSMLKWLDTETDSGRITTDISAFIAGFIGAGKFTKAIKFGGNLTTRAQRIRKSFVDGALSDFVIGDPEAPRLANYLPESLKGPVTEYLAYNPEADNNRLEERLKNSVEGVLIGAGLGIFAEGFLHSMKAMKTSLSAAAENREGYNELLRRTAGDDIAIQAAEAERKTTFESLEKSPLMKDAEYQHLVGMAREGRAAIPLTKETAKELTQKFNPSSKLMKEGTDEEVLMAIDKDIRELSLLDDVDAVWVYTAKATRAVSKRLTAKRRASTDPLVFDKKLMEETEVTLRGLTNKPSSAAKMLFKNNDIGAMHAQVTIAKAIISQQARQLEDKALHLLKHMDDAKAQESFKKAFDNYFDALPLLRAPVSAAGRALQAATRRAQKSLPELINRAAPEVDVTRALKQKKKFQELWAKGLKSRETKRMLEEVSRAKGNLKHIERAVENNRHWMDFVHEFRIVSMMSGIGSQSVNIFGTQSRLMYESLVENTVSLGVDKVVRSADYLKGNKQAFKEAEAITIREWAGEVVGTFTGINQFFAALRRASAKRGGLFKEGTLTEATVDGLTRGDVEAIRHSNALKLDPEGKHFLLRPFMHGFNLYAEGAHRMVFGTMGVFDGLGKSMRFTGKVRGLAAQYAHRAGLTGPAATDYADNLVALAARYAQNADEVGDYLRAVAPDSMDDMLKVVKDVHEQGISAAKKSTFQSPIANKMLSKFEEGLHSDNLLARTVRTFVVPFFRTPINILSFVFERSPGINLLAKSLRDDIMGKSGRAAQSRAVGQMVSGLAVWGGIGWLVQNKMITGAHPPSERKALLQNEFPEYSVYVPAAGAWFKYNRLDPLGLPLGLAADMVSLSRYNEEGEHDKVVNSFILALSNNLVNKTYLKGMSDLLGAVQDPERFRQSYMKSQLRPFVPMSGMQHSLDSIVDMGREDAPDLTFKSFDEAVRTTWANAWKDLPGSDALPEKTDMLGIPIRRPEGHWHTVAQLLGVPTQAHAEGPGRRALARLKRPINTEDLVLEAGLKMEPEVAEQFKRVLREDVRFEERLDRLVMSPSFRRATEVRQDALITRLFRKSSSRAKKILLKKNPLLRDLVLDQKKANRLAKYTRLKEAPRDYSEDSQEVLDLIIRSRRPDPDDFLEE